MWDFAAGSARHARISPAAPRLLVQGRHSRSPGSSRFRQRRGGRNGACGGRSALVQGWAGRHRRHGPRRRMARRGCEDIEAAVGHGGEEVLIVDAIRKHRTDGLPYGPQEGVTGPSQRRSMGRAPDSSIGAMRRDLSRRSPAQGAPRRPSSAGQAAFPDFSETPSTPCRGRQEPAAEGGGPRTAGAAGGCAGLAACRRTSSERFPSGSVFGCSSARSRRLFPGGADVSPIRLLAAMRPERVGRRSATREQPVAGPSVLRGRRDNPWSGEEWT
ncbi:hypothetical protein D3C72_984910 [compost metagenome]